MDENYTCSQASCDQLLKRVTDLFKSAQDHVYNLIGTGT